MEIHVKVLLLPPPPPLSGFPLRLIIYTSLTIAQLRTQKLMRSQIRSYSILCQLNTNVLYSCVSVNSKFDENYNSYNYNCFQ